MALSTVHVLLLVAWLGIDVGVFASSFLIRRRDLPGRARVELRRLMRGLDLAPRLSVVLTIPVGVGLAYSTALVSVPASAMAAITVIALGWCAAIIWAYRRMDSLGRLRHSARPPASYRIDPGRWFAHVDLTLRLLALVLLSATAVQTLIVGTGIWGAGYIAWKVLLFAGTIAAGLVIRSRARPFTPALRRVVEDGPNEADLMTMDRAMRAVYPAVLYIWASLVVIAVIAIANP